MPARRSVFPVLPIHGGSPLFAPDVSDRKMRQTNWQLASRTAQSSAHLPWVTGSSPLRPSSGCCGLSRIVAVCCGLLRFPAMLVRLLRRSSAGYRIMAMHVRCDMIRLPARRGMAVMPSSVAGQGVSPLGILRSDRSADRLSRDVAFGRGEKARDKRSSVIRRVIHRARCCRRRPRPPSSSSP